VRLRGRKKNGDLADADFERTLEPVALGTRALNVTPGGGGSVRISSSASASCGTQRGETKLVSSMRVRPASINA
jgi:hypothetical protein